MGGDMWLVLAWAALGLVAHSTYASKYIDETIEELEEELRAKGEDSGVLNSDEDELFDLLASSEESGEAAPEWNVKPKWKPKWKPRKSSYESSEEVIESIDEIKSMTPIKKIEEVKSITPVKSLEEVKSITPVKSIEEVKSIKEIKSILPVPDDIAKKFIRKNNLVPMDGGGASNPPEIDLSDDELDVDEAVAGELLEALQEGVITIQAALDKISAQGLTLCDNSGGRVKPRDEWDSIEEPDNDSDSVELPFSAEDVTNIEQITAMEEVKSMLPIKSIDEIKSITPIKSIQEVKGLYELTDRQARLLRKLNRGDEGGYGGYGRYGDDED